MLAINMYLRKHNIKSGFLHFATPDGTGLLGKIFFFPIHNESCVRLKAITNYDIMSASANGI